MVIPQRTARRLVDGVGHMAGIYLTLRISAILLLISQLGIRLIFPEPTIFSDVFLFNLAGFFAAASSFVAPLFNDRLATASISVGILMRSAGSFVSSWNSFLSFQIWSGSSEIAYGLFYPLILFGMIRALSAKRAVNSIELLEVIIIGLGVSSVIAALLLKPAMMHFEGAAFSIFLSILYPIGDVILLAIGLIFLILHGRSLRSLLLVLGIALFSATDLLFLWLSGTSGYPFASLLDDGWLLGLILIAESLWHPGGERQLSGRVTSVAATISLILSSALLALAAFRPGYFPNFVLIPAFITITLAFIRMAVALRDARATHEERALARTDELTGLANRRHFLLELQSLGNGPGTLLLLDLDGFKAVNDSFGHESGDELLREISVRFTRVLTSNSLLARLGGDEFGVVVHGTPAEGLEVANALRSALSYPFTISHQSVSVGVSIGRVVNDGREGLLKRADSAMYEAKRTHTGVVLWQN